MAALAVASFAFCQATTRFFADPFVERHSPAGVARSMTVVMAIGVALVYFSPHPLASLAGFALLGIGSATVFPLAISAAAQRIDRPARSIVASLTQLSFGAFLLGPPLLGFVAEHWGIRAAFGVALPLVVLTFFTAPSLGGRPIRKDGPPGDGDAVARVSAHQDAY